MLVSGDSCLIVTPKNKKILIDGGGSERGSSNIGEKTLLPYLLNRKVNKLDYAIISHFDSDHCEGVLYVMQKIKVENVIIGKQFETCENYKEFIKIVKQKNIRVISVEKGNKVNIEKDMYFNVIWPDSNNIVNENKLNNNSLVFKMNYKNTSALFTGDIEKIAEEKIISYVKEDELKSTIIKVAHHGSKTSSTEKFIEKVKPKIALIGVGENNTFGHPSNITIETLEKAGTKIYRTDKMGEIILQINKKGQIKISNKISTNKSN